LDDLLGRGISIELVTAGDQPRFFHGFVAECSQVGRLGRYARYSARVVPWLWLLSHSMQSGKLTHTDFDFTKPRTSLLAQNANPGNYPKSSAELFAYPGGYATVSDGSHYAQRRLEAVQQQHERVSGSGNAYSISM